MGILSAFGFGKPAAPPDQISKEHYNVILLLRSVDDRDNRRGSSKDAERYLVTAINEVMGRDTTGKDVEERLRNKLTSLSVPLSEYKTLLNKQRLKVQEIRKQLKNAEAVEYLSKMILALRTMEDKMDDAAKEMNPDRAPELLLEYDSSANETEAAKYALEKHIRKIKTKIDDDIRLLDYGAKEFLKRVVAAQS